MKMPFKVVLIFCSVCFVACTSCAQWYDLRDDQRYVDDFSLNPGDIIDLTIESDEELWVGFTSDISVEKAEKYKNNKYPVKMDQKEGGSSVSSSFGGATIFKPIDGKINLQVSNKSKNDIIKVVIYTNDVDD